MVAPGLSQSNGLTIYAFDASQLGVYAQPLGNDSFTPVSPDDVLAASGAIAALDGPQFDNCPGQNLPFDNAGAYAASRCGSPGYFVYDGARGVAAGGRNPSDGITVAIQNGQANVYRGAQAPPGTQVAVQLWPPLVVNGQNVASNTGSNATVERRAALVVFSPTQLAFVVGAMDMVSFADAIQSLGATFAGYTDGGGSTSLVLPDNTYGAAERRRVPTWLVVNSKGISGGAIFGALVVAGIVGGLLYATTRLKVRRNPSTNEALRYLESQSEPPGWPGDVEIVTIPTDSRAPVRSHTKDRSVYPLREIPIKSLVTTQPVVDRAHVAWLLESGGPMEPILVTPYRGRLGYRYAIQDGHHRAYAASLRGDRTIWARVAPAPLRSVRIAKNPHLV